jgi:hypothetical protein
MQPCQLWNQHRSDTGQNRHDQRCTITGGIPNRTLFRDIGETKRKVDCFQVNSTTHVEGGTCQFIYGAELPTDPRKIKRTG